MIYRGQRPPFFIAMRWNDIRTSGKASMINEDTPDKLAEIIKMTWPGLYMRPVKQEKRQPEQEQKDDAN